MKEKNIPNILRNLGKEGRYIFYSCAEWVYIATKMIQRGKTPEEAEEEAKKIFGPEISEELGLKKKK